MAKNVIYFAHKITMLEKRPVPFRHISSILSLSLSGLSIPITPTISRKPSVLTGTRFSSFYRRTDVPTDTFFAAARCRKSGRNRFCIALPCCTNVGNLSCPFRLPRFWSELTTTLRGGHCFPFLGALQAASGRVGVILFNYSEVQSQCAYKLIVN